MKQKWMKKCLSLLLTAALTVTLIPAAPGGTKTVKAAEEAEVPGLNAYATTNDLMNSYDLDGDGEDTVGELIFGKSGGLGLPQKWFIVGKDTGYGAPSGDNTILFATQNISSRLYDDMDDNDADSKEYWTYFTYENDTNDPHKLVCVTHYGASNLRQELKKMETSTDYFSVNEQALMNTTRISCYDRTNSYGYLLNEKLYLPEAAGQTAVEGDGYVYVGAGDPYDTTQGKKEKIALSHWTEKFDVKPGVNNGFWIRTEMTVESDDPIMTPFTTYGLCGTPTGTAKRDVHMESGISPAVNINLTNVAFASSVPTETITASKKQRGTASAYERIRCNGR